MPRFFFHIFNDEVTLDEEGLLLPSAAAAAREALRSARSLAASDVAAGRLNLTHRIDVLDETHAVIASVSFSDAIDLTI